MENWVGETRRDGIILIQSDIIKCRNQRLLVAQNLLEPWSGYLHFLLTCCSLFTKTKLFQKGWNGDRDVHKSLEKKRQKKQKKSTHKTTLQQKAVLQEHPAKQRQKNPWQHWWWHYFEIFFPKCVFQATRRKFALCKDDSRECLGTQRISGINELMNLQAYFVSELQFFVWLVLVDLEEGMTFHHPAVTDVAPCSSGICTSQEMMPWSSLTSYRLLFFPAPAPSPCLPTLATITTFNSRYQAGIFHSFCSRPSLLTELPQNTRGSCWWRQFQLLQ